jgi:hypothetical protein
MPLQRLITAPPTGVLVPNLWIDDVTGDIYADGIPQITTITIPTILINEGLGGGSGGGPTSSTSFTSTAGNFQIAHGLGYTPVQAIIQLTSEGGLGIVAFQAPLEWDSTYFYMAASDSGLIGSVLAWE